jgi:hypothetical protein
MDDELRAALELLDNYLTGNDLPGFLVCWRAECELNRSYATDILGCFERLAEHPPSELRQRAPADFVAWFRELRDGMRALYDETKYVELSDESRALRADPEGAFYDYLKFAMTRNDEHGFLILWRNQCRNHSHAADLMYCFDQVVENPPADLIEKYQEVTGYVMNHITPAQITKFSFDEYVAWFRALRDQMRAVFEESSR